MKNSETAIFENFVKEVKTKARIFVIVGDSDAHLGLLDAMYKQNLFNKDNVDQYFVIGIYLEVWDQKSKSYICFKNSGK